MATSNAVAYYLESKCHAYTYQTQSYVPQTFPATSCPTQSKMGFRSTGEQILVVPDHYRWISLHVYDRGCRDETTLHCARFVYDLRDYSVNQSILGKFCQIGMLVCRIWWDGVEDQQTSLSQVKPGQTFATSIRWCRTKLSNDIEYRSYIPFWDGHTLGLEFLCYRVGGL